MTPLDLVRLTPLIDRTSGRPELTIGLIDGPVVMDHPDLPNQRIREIPGSVSWPLRQTRQLTTRGFALNEVGSTTPQGARSPSAGVHQCVDSQRGQRHV